MTTGGVTDGLSHRPIAGALYLAYLGAKLLLTKTPQEAASLDTLAEAGDAGSAFRQGIITNVLNPKVALFFLALLPQFINPDSTSKTLAFLVLGAARLRQFLRGNPRVRTAIDRVTGGLFIALGIRLATDR